MDTENQKDSEKTPDVSASPGLRVPVSCPDFLPRQDGPTAGIPVVGLGGSAGALAAFEALFKTMPEGSGAAFVVIQHMSPAHESLLPEILAHHTPMPVVQAQDGMRLEPNRVYVIPPNRDLGLRDGAFSLAGRVRDAHGLHMPIDSFFRCLAEDREELAIGILFSGTGSDGTLGARAIRGAGGMVISQDPQTAQFDDMPRSAIEAGLADHVLAPDEMAQAVLHYLAHPYVKGRWRAKGGAVGEKPRDVQEVLALIVAQTGCDFRCYKPPTILRRIGRRMGLLHIQDVPEYVALLRRDASEVNLLLKDLLINVTSFFRDTEAFDVVREKAIAPLVQARTNEDPVRVWVPACATGEEAYSLAILLMEELAKAGKTCPLQVYATDLDADALDVARAGFYPQNIAADVSPERLGKFFIHRNRGYQVRESLREVLTFATQDVIIHPPFSRMDMISCRNLLIYLDSDAQAKLIALFNFALKPGGYLFLGRSEAVAGQSELFEVISSKARLCRRLSPARPLRLDSPILPGRRRAPPPAEVIPGRASPDFAPVIWLEMLRHFNAAAVLVDRKGKILQFHGETDRYLNLPAPGPDFNVFDLAKRKLGTTLRLAIHKAVQDDETVILDSVPFTREEGPAFVRVTAAPVLHRAGSQPLLVVFFEDMAGAPLASDDVLKFPPDEAAIARLEDELRVTQQDLQGSIEELQSSNEELRAAYEEVSSTNEELESTNEELESSTEELRSVNEELTATVSQLQEKVGLLDQAKEALGKSEQQFRALVESSPNGMLLITADGSVAMANRQVEAMFGYPRNVLLGQQFEVLVPERFRKSYRAQLAAAPRQHPMGAGRDLFALRKDGTEFPVEISLTPLDMPEGMATLATITDIAGRKRLEP